MRKLLLPVAALITGLSGIGDAFAQQSAFVKITAPAPNQCVPGPDVTIHFEAGGICLSPCGNNLHFKLDDEPFEVQFDGNHPHVFKDVKPGTHTVRAFAANAMHEAMPGSLDMVTFHVGYANGQNAPEPGSPVVTYNLPQGEYLGVDAGDITVDFLVRGTNLAPGGNRIAYYVDGKRFLVHDTCPRHVQGLSPGFHTFRVELQDGFGDTIEGPFNNTERTILVSPGRSRKSPSMPDKSPPLPRIDSIKGSMTMGRPWLAMEEAPPASAAQKAKASTLTVRKGGVNGDGSGANFQVRPGGTQETETVVEFDTTVESTETNGQVTEAPVSDGMSETRVERTVVTESAESENTEREATGTESGEQRAEDAAEVQTSRARPETRTTGTLAQTELQKRARRNAIESSSTIRVDDPDTTEASGARRPGRKKEKDSDPESKERGQNRKLDKVQPLIDAGPEVTSGTM